MLLGLHRRVMVALLIMGSAILLFSCKGKQNVADESLDAIKTEESENLTIVMSENGRKSYLFKTPLLEGYTLGRDPYREFRKGISITTYQDDSLTTVNAVLVANYAIYYEKRKLWEAKGDVVITKHDGTRLYTQQLFWNSITKRIYSNVDTKLVTATDEVIGEGFESDEEMNEPRFRRWKGRMQVDAEQLRNGSQSDTDNERNNSDAERKTASEKVEQKGKQEAKSNLTPQLKSQPKAQPKSQPKAQPNGQMKSVPQSKLQSDRSTASKQPMAPIGKPMRGGGSLRAKNNANAKMESEEVKSSPSIQQK